MKVFELTREELTRQLYQTIQELYPDRLHDPNRIDNLLSEPDQARMFVFRAKEFAESAGFAAEDFMQKLYLELGIEFEKNLHDKFLFEMTRNDNNIIFTPIESDKNG